MQTATLSACPQFKISVFVLVVAVASVPVVLAGDAALLLCCAAAVLLLC